MEHERDWVKGSLSRTRYGVESARLRSGRERIVFAGVDLEQPLFVALQFVAVDVLERTEIPGRPSAHHDPSP